MSGLLRLRELRGVEDLQVALDLRYELGEEQRAVVTAPLESALVVAGAGRHVHRLRRHLSLQALHYRVAADHHVRHLTVVAPLGAALLLQLALVRRVVDAVFGLRGRACLLYTSPSPRDS